MDVRYLKKLIQIVECSGISELEIEDGGSKVRIVKSAQAGHGAHAVPVAAAMPFYLPAPSANPGAAAASAREQAPAVADGKQEDSKLWRSAPRWSGTFYRAPSPGSDPFVEVGDRVAVGQTLCILEAMKIMNEIESEVAGMVRKICVENGQPVEFGQRLFLVEPAVELAECSRRS